MLPEILLFGEAGSGKDTVADILAKSYGSVSVAMADPMKRLCEYVFDFSENQLWGPSERRNAPDFRYNAVNVGEGKAKAAWERARERLDKGWVLDWVVTVLTGHSYNVHNRAFVALGSKWLPMIEAEATKKGFLAPRLPLQLLGTEWGRGIDNTMWIRTARRTQRQLLCGGYDYHRKTGLEEKPGQKYELATVTDGRFPNECLEFKAGGALVINVLNPETNQNTGVATAGTAGHESERHQKSMPSHWFDAVIVNDKRRGLTALRSKVMDLAALKLGALIL
jgi:hypothetical protein